MIIARVIGHVWATKKEEALEGKGFARCNKGYLVNLAHVDAIQDGCAVVRGDRLLISRGRRGPFLEASDQLPVDCAIVGIIDSLEITKGGSDGK